MREKVIAGAMSRPLFVITLLRFHILLEIQEKTENL